MFCLGTVGLENCWDVELLIEELLGWGIVGMGNCWGGDLGMEPVKINTGKGSCPSISFGNTKHF